MSEQDFENFWQEYPKKVGKKKACERFLKLKKNVLPMILEALKKQKFSSSWQENGGQFVPYPLTWLCDERWEDEVVIAHKSAHQGYVSTYGEAALIVTDDDV